jgi:hypothetical protein
MNLKASSNIFHLAYGMEAIYHGLPDIGMVVGTYAAVPYIHLQLEARRRFYPDVPLLVHDDASPEGPRLAELCVSYGVDFESNSERQPYHLGDLTAFLGGLRWADRRKLDILVKTSRRWVFLTRWVEDLQRLALDSQYATFSNYTTTYGFGFRTESIGLATKRWASPEFFRPTIAAIRRRLHVFVEAYIHQHAVEFERSNCFQAIRWKQEHPMPPDKMGYAQWHLIGTDRGRSDPARRWLWHDCDPPRAYAEIAQHWGLPYEVKDFEDPNQGNGTGSPLDHDATPFSKPTAWAGLESKYQRFLSNVRPIRRAVEIGVDYGWSLFHMAMDFRDAVFFGVDPHLTNPEAGEWVTKHAKNFPNVRLLKMDSEEACRVIEGTVDLVHIDGDHRYESVRRDFELWSPKVAPGGCILFHDVAAIADVRRLFDELPGRKEMIQDHFGLGCWYKEP